MSRLKRMANGGLIPKTFKEQLIDLINEEAVKDVDFNEQEKQITIANILQLLDLAIEEARGSQWISVDEQLPTQYHVLLCLRNKDNNEISGPFFATYYKDSNTWYYTHGEVSIEVQPEDDVETFVWQPLPLPPVEKQ